MSDSIRYAPGWPGIPPRWTSSAKSGVGTALNRNTNVWFTLSHGILNEIYYPRADSACTRDSGLIVTNGRDYFSEEKRDARNEVSYIARGVPAYRLVNTCNGDRYTIQKDIIADPRRDVILQRIRFTPNAGYPDTYHLYTLLAPHLGNQGSGNTAWVGDYKGVPMLFAQRDDIALALACSAPWSNRSVGFVGASDSWQDLKQHYQMTWFYDRAENGNVNLTGEIDLSGPDGSFVLALGLGQNPAEAGNRALSSLQDDYDELQKEYIQGWKDWQAALFDLSSDQVGQHSVYHVSASVLRIHESKRFPGSLIASLSIPWGFAKGDNDLGGYHLIWPRDLVESAGGLLAAGANEDAMRVLDYLESTQEAEGLWPQNMWSDGTPYWSGIQLDEAAFPILLVDLAQRKAGSNARDLARYWSMVRRAAGYLVRNGPVTQQDRWEEDPGFSPFTLAVEIAALLVAADLADANHEPDMAAYLRETADLWNENVERWTYVTGTDLAKQYGVEGYYVRIAPPEVADAASPAGGFVPIKNRPPGQSSLPAASIISPDALALVRFGLRAPGDPRILNTVKVIDALLRVETPRGPCWHRYNDDGYGEHEDGSPFDGTGVGRVWPLLTGERAHYELAAGNQKEAQRLMKALHAFSNKGGLIPEQIWDSPDIPEKELYFGQPSGSAMPLVWAHAEYIKLLRSLHDGQVFDMPPQTVQRYQKQASPSPYAVWRFNHRCRSLPLGKKLRLELLAPALVHWSSDGWKTPIDTYTQDVDVGIYVADLPTDTLPEGSTVSFTFYWTGTGRWEGTNYEVEVSK